MIIIHDDKGTTYGPRAYLDVVDRRTVLGWKASNYHVGKSPPNYPVPALYDTYPDAEYLVMLARIDAIEKQIEMLRSERAIMEMELRNITGETNH